MLIVSFWFQLKAHRVFADRPLPKYLSSTKRIEHDLDQAIRIADALDKHKEIESGLCVMLDQTEVGTRLENAGSVRFWNEQSEKSDLFIKIAKLAGANNTSSEVGYLY